MYKRIDLRVCQQPIALGHFRDAWWKGRHATYLTCNLLQLFPDLEEGQVKNGIATSHAPGTLLQWIRTRRQSAKPWKLRPGTFTQLPQASLTKHAQSRTSFMPESTVRHLTEPDVCRVPGKTSQKVRARRNASVRALRMMTLSNDGYSCRKVHCGYCQDK